jgi:imidazole glycerol phosphate synthase subunit HisF
MLKKRIIPALLIKDNLLVKTRKFKNARSIGSIIEAVKLYTFYIKSSIHDFYMNDHIKDSTDICNTIIK